MILNDLKQHKLLAHKGRCFDIRYSQDNNFLLSACEDGNAVLWDVKLRKVRYMSFVRVTTFQEDLMQKKSFLNAKECISDTEIFAGVRNIEA